MNDIKNIMSFKDLIMDNELISKLKQLKWLI